jgi:hypothetical protein
MAGFSEISAPTRASSSWSSSRLTPGSRATNVVRRWLVAARAASTGRQRTRPRLPRGAKAIQFSEHAIVRHQLAVAGVRLVDRGVELGQSTRCKVALDLVVVRSNHDCRTIGQVEALGHDHTTLHACGEEAVTMSSLAPGAQLACEAMPVILQAC